MNPEIRKKILMLNAKGLSQFYIAKELKIKHWEAKRVVEEEARQDFDSLFIEQD